MKKKKMIRNKKIQRGRKSFRDAFPMVAFFLFLVSIVVVGATYAWFSASDKLTNHFQAESFDTTPNFDVKIEEVFTPNKEWPPGKVQTKEIRVRNNGTTPAFVRISLKEALVLFRIDAVTGNLAVRDTAAAKTINDQDGSNWEAVANESGTYKQGEGKYLIANQGISYQNLAFNLEGRNALFSPVTVNFSDSVYDATPTNGVKNYWIYQNGYFYYSELVAPGELTEMLVKSVSLSKSMPNAYKGMLYHLKPVMDAHDASKAIETDWGIEETGIIYEMYKDKLK